MHACIYIIKERKRETERETERERERRKIRKLFQKPLVFSVRALLLFPDGACTQGFPPCWDRGGYRNPMGEYMFFMIPALDPTQYYGQMSWEHLAEIPWLRSFGWDHLPEIPWLMIVVRPNTSSAHENLFARVPDCSHEFTFPFRSPFLDLVCFENWMFKELSTF